jgi:predicted transcriptional regulator
MPRKIMNLTSLIVRSIASETKLTPKEIVDLIRNVYAILDGLDRKANASEQNPTITFPDYAMSAD